MGRDLTLVVNNTIDTVRPSFEKVLVDSTLTFEREAGFARQLICGSEFAMKTAVNNPQSLINAVTNVAAFGITLNPAKKLAYLVPRDGRICLDISYMGLVHIAVESGSVRWAQARSVHANDDFAPGGVDEQPHHKFDPFDPERGEIRGIYVVAKTLQGDYLTEFMSVADINGIRDRSSAWKAYRKGDIKTCPWVTDWEEMGKKTVAKRAHKWWPKTDRLSQAIEYMNTEAGEGLPEIQRAGDAPPSKASASTLDRARAAADKGRAEFGKWWKEATPAEREELRHDVNDLKARTEKADQSRTVDAEHAAFVDDMDREESRQRRAA